jgi:hypothetical protein
MPDIEKSLQQLLVTNFGLSPSGYAGSRGDTGYVGSGGLGYTGSVGPAGAGASGPRITSIGYPDDDTAADITGGQTITLTGANFASGAQVIINGNTASVVSFVNSTTITFTAPPNPTGSYILYVLNPDGATTIAVPGLQYSGTPSWTTTAGSLGNPVKQTSFTTNLSATGDAPISYNVYSGALPAGLTLAANTGVISGTTPNVAVDTTYNFTVRATDAQLQDTNRAFSIQVRNVPTVDYLLIAGGGGGGDGNAPGGGGGAGGYRSITNVPITLGTLTVTIGAGGTGGSGDSRGNAGNNSTISGISSYSATGGGYGGGYNVNGNGGSGGSGGGGSGPTGTGTGGSGNAGGYSPVEGYAGGTCGGFSQYGGGGGGAGGVGTFAGSGGDGGPGATWLDGVIRAGGGGGARLSQNENGGAGGGGRGATINGGGNGVAGATNTGSGGGAACDSTGGAGGSGVFIVRYLTGTVTASGGTVTTASGYTYHTFTSSGALTVS